MESNFFTKRERVGILPVSSSVLAKELATHWVFSRETGRDQVEAARRADRSFTTARTNRAVKPIRLNHAYDFLTRGVASHQAPPCRRECG